MTRTMRLAMLTVVGSIAIGLAGGPGLAQTDDDDDDMSGGALAVLLLAVGGAVATNDLAGPIKTSLAARNIRSSDAQVQSLAEQAAAQLKSMRGAGQFTVCAADGPCIRIVRE